MANKCRGCDWPTSVEGCDWPTSVEGCDWPTSVEECDYPTFVERRPQSRREYTPGVAWGRGLEGPGLGNTLVSSQCGHTSCEGMEWKIYSH